MNGGFYQSLSQMTPDCEVFAIQVAEDGQKNLKINSGDNILCLLLVCSELRSYPSHEHSLHSNDNRLS